MASQETLLLQQQSINLNETPTQMLKSRCVILKPDQVLDVDAGPRPVEPGEHTGSHGKNGGGIQEVYLASCQSMPVEAS